MLKLFRKTPEGAEERKPETGPGKPPSEEPAPTEPAAKGRGVLRFVTSNPEKVREAAALLPRQVVMVELELIEPQTTTLRTLVESKARQAFEQLQMPLMVEDTALYFEAWKGLPGPFVKYFERNLGLEGMVDALSPFDNWDAEAVCGVGYHDGNQIHYFEGRVRGLITPPTGENGFGWDRIFIPLPHSRTFAEMSPEEKNLLSMRAEALNKLAQYFHQREA